MNTKYYNELMENGFKLGKTNYDVSKVRLMALIFAEKIDEAGSTGEIDDFWKLALPTMENSIEEIMGTIDRKSHDFPSLALSVSAFELSKSIHSELFD